MHYASEAVEGPNILKLLVTLQYESVCQQQKTLCHGVSCALEHKIQKLAMTLIQLQLLGDMLRNSAQETKHNSWSTWRPALFCNIVSTG